MDRYELALCHMRQQLDEPGPLMVDESVVAAHIPLVKAIARRYERRPCEHADVFSDGMFGLAKAALSFDPTRDVKFSTFATWYVRGQILDGIRDRIRRQRHAWENPEPLDYRLAAPRPTTLSDHRLALALYSATAHAPPQNLERRILAKLEGASGGWNSLAAEFGISVQRVLVRRDRLIARLRRRILADEQAELMRAGDDVSAA